MSNHNEFAAQVVRHLPEMTEAERQAWITHPRQLKMALRAAMDIEKVNSFLNPIPFAEALPLPACNNTRSLAQATDVFPGWIEPNFKNWGLDVVGIATPEMLVQVHEQVKDGTFRQLFKSLSSNLDKLVMTQHQIIMFCQTYPHWLRQDGFATLFLFKENGEFFVAKVRMYSDGLRVCLGRFKHDDVWPAGRSHRLVVPQLDGQ